MFHDDKEFNYKGRYHDAEYVHRVAILSSTKIFKIIMIKDNLQWIILGPKIFEQKIVFN